MSDLLSIIGDAGAMYGYAQERTEAADAYILSLARATANLAPPVIQPEFPTVDNAPQPVTATPPTLQPVVWAAPAMPTAFSGALNIDGLMPEPFDADPPALNFAAVPAAFAEPAPASPGITTDFGDPVLDLALPTAPALLTLNIVPMDGISLPTIDSTVPVLDVVAPGVISYVPGQSYTSSLLETVKGTLQSRIANGGTGLAPAVEQAIWDRAREREYRAQADALAELERMETLGYAFPPGVYLDARLKIQTETQAVVAGLSREVMIKQAELELANVLKAIDSAVGLEGKLIDYINAIEQRSFESCRYATQAGIEVYNARVRAYAAYLDAYKTKVEIYKARIQGELAKVEVYKAQIAAEQTKAEINTALVQQYRVQSEVALSAVEVYKARIQGIATKAQIEQTKVAMFGEQVRAYGARVSAYSAGIEAYRAGIQAEGAKQDAFKTRVQAYATRVDAATKHADAKIEEFKGFLQAKAVEWDGYKAATAGQASLAQATGAYNQSQVEGFRAVVAGTSAFNETLTKQWQAAIEEAARIAEVGVSAAKANAELYMTTRSLALDAAKVGAQVSAQLGASALNAINWSSSISGSVVESASTSFSTNTSTSNVNSNSSSTSTSTNTNYNTNV